MLEVKNLKASYGNHLALDQVSVSVAEGETVAILGANGAGKTTFLGSVAGLLGPRPSGTIEFLGVDISALPPHQIVEDGIALVPQGRGIFGALSVSENLELGGYPKRARGVDDRRLKSILSYFPRLSERLTQRVDTMSGGEQQMVAIGRALMSRPALLMLDEPSLGLSPIMTSELFRALKRIRNDGTAVLIVEQNARKTLEMADRAYLLGNGRILGHGNARDLSADPAVSAAYLGSGTAKLSQAEEAKV